jgi:hypothetical protein
LPSALELVMNQIETLRFVIGELQREVAALDNSELDIIITNVRRIL